MIATTARSDQTSSASESFAQLTPRRHRRPGWVFAGFGLIVLSMLIGALLYTWTSTTEGRLALNRSVGAGHVIKAADLKRVEVNPDSSFESVPFEDQAKIIDMVAQGPLPEGQLLSMDLFANESLSLTEGKAVVAATLPVGFLPSEVASGATVQMYSAVGESGEGLQGEADLLGTATVQATAAESGSPVVRVSLIVEESVAPKVIQASADSNLSLVVVARS